MSETGPRRMIVRLPLNLGDPWRPGEIEHRNHVQLVLAASGKRGFTFKVANREGRRNG